MPKLLNIGCGSRTHPDWINIDSNPRSGEVIKHNAANKLPFSDTEFDFVYHSHLLEHLTKSQGKHLTGECYRILKSGGILRIAVPNLEIIARTYLECLERADRKEFGWDNNYEWILLEMYDQAVREIPGGEMLKYLSQDVVPNLEFVKSRFGHELDNILKAINSSKHTECSTPEQPFSLKSKVPNRILHPIYSIRSTLKQAILKKLLADDYVPILKAKPIISLHENGEIHKWMYDRYSLRKLLTECSFDMIKIMSANQSYLANWADYNLDTQKDGTIRKPDSMYIEGIKMEG